MKRRILLALLAALLASPLACDSAPDDTGLDGRGGTGGVPAEEAPVPLVEVESLVVQPGSGRDFLLDALAAAKKQVRVELYAITDDEMEYALADTARRGIEVRAILPSDNDEVNAEAISRLQAAGVEIRGGNPAFATTHEKALVIDDDLAFVLTQNLSYSGFEYHREFNAIVRGQAARDVAEIFEADWAEVPFDRPTDLVLSPNNSRERLETLIKSAEESIDVAIEVMTDGRVIDLLGARAQRGIRVRVLLRAPEDMPANAAGAKKIQAQGVDVRWLPQPSLHAKAVVVDGRFAYIGSVNFTTWSFDKNRELGLVTADEEALATIRATFERDFANGRTDF